jgi:phosphatidylserine/phosphatidylglycerophosphate/cardiolipin synthase-like enzyme
VSRSGLSSLATAVLQNIETNPAALGDSPVATSLLLSTCNHLDSIQIDGPRIYAMVRDTLALADHEVDMAFYQWEENSAAVSLIGDGLIAAQARRTPSDPLLVRIVIDDVDSLFSPDRAINHLWNSQKLWMTRGLDTSRVRLQLATSPRPTAAAANLHDKLAVVDGKYVVVTGANPEAVHDPPAPWHDSGYRLQGDVARSALSAFEHTWTGDAVHWDCRDEFLSHDCDKLPYHYPQPARGWLSPLGSSAVGDIPVLAVGRTKGNTLPPDNDTNNPQDIAWLTIMDRAASHIHIESPNLNDDAFRDAVVRAVGRGVTVQLIAALGFNFTASNLPTQGGDNEEVVGDLRERIRAASPQNLERFEVRWYSQDGLEPVEGNGHGANHTKYMSVDDRVAVVGSGNMETPSWNISHEFDLLMDDAFYTSAIENALFLPDWSTSIGNYAELYEGNGGTQDVVCSIAVNRVKNVRFPDTTFCDNDETRSLLLHDVPAGRVLRFYDDPDRRYEDDDWSEIVVKRPVRRKYIDSYERSFEDEDVRVIYHRDNGLDGKVSAAEVAAAPVGAVVDLYEGNGGTQSLVCSNRVSDNRTINLTQDAHCNNDEARSLTLYDFPADKVIFLYDDPGGSQGDDWAVIVPQRPISQATVGTFESSVQTPDLRVCYFLNNGLDGKVSRIRIGSLSEAAGLCGVPLN